MMVPKKILIVRFSSIGDIVLTTPVIRCLHQQLPGTEIHFVCKAVFASVLDGNPYIHLLHTFKKDISELYEALKSENFDLLVDLHKNLRSFRLKRKLKTRSFSFNKINFNKFLAVNFKMLGQLPDVHIVDRYLSTVAPLGVQNDGQGLDYFPAEKDQVAVSELFPAGASSFVALVVGGSYYTKQIPMNKLQKICDQLNLPVVLLGGKEDQAIGEELQARYPTAVNACGRYTINQSASVIRQAAWVITSDTGMMHIASAFNKKIISVWGNTVPEFGMGPYLPAPESMILEVKALECRPCSKLGYHECPLGHFKCMNDIDVSVVETLR
ncbi:MAG: glycosyltransferase family 9 protein [Bacteroidota bacterium]